ncbi:MAG TPA: M20/M25/M40 family metallo-hydrolase [Candidatus Limnocylindria bacterium]
MDLPATGRFARVACAALLLLAGCGGDVAPSDSAPTPRPVAPSAEAPARVTTVDEASIGEHLDALQAIADSNDGVRTVGTSGYDASVDYVAATMGDLGFAVEVPDVAYTGFRELPGATVEVGGATWGAPDDLHALIYSAGGNVSGPVVMLDESGCAGEDFAAVAEGSIAVTTRGGCFRRDQALNAVEAGVAALIVGYADRAAGEIYRPTLIDPGGMTIPVVSVSAPVVAALEAAEGEEARLSVATEREAGTFRQVVAELGDGPSVIVVGAHLDSVFEGPGINDNGSGVAALLEIGRAIADVGVPDGWAVRLAFWGAEELGTVGSRAYAGSLEPDEVAAYLNVDMAGSVAGANLVYDEPSAPPGSDRITDLLSAWFDDHGLPWAPADLGGSSDHYGFQVAGIPTGGLFAGATASGSAALPGSSAAPAAPDPCYHLACDTRSNVDLERVTTFATAIADVVLALTEDEP